MSDKEKLFNPNLFFKGDPKKYLEGYPTRSKNLEELVDYKQPKDINNKFVKDGYIYLLRGGKDGQETGFYSREYANKGTIENLGLNPISVAHAQNINGNTPFISATTDLSTAAAFSLKQRIYILKIPVEDVYTFYKNELLEEKEVMIPDYISSDEIIKSFRFDKFKQIYGYLTREIGLDITPEDLGETYETIKNPDMDKIDLYIYSNESCSFLDDTLNKLSEAFTYSDKLIREEAQPKRQIAILTDIHGLLEPTEAILKDIEKRGINEIYSLGDNIGLGPNPNEVLELLNQHKVISIAGNHEEYINLGYKPFASYLTDSDIENIRWMNNNISNDNKDKIKLYPHFIELSLGKSNIVLCHFINDVRCDFGVRSTYSYLSSREIGLSGYSQFFYTNSDDHLKNIAYALNLSRNIPELNSIENNYDKLQYLRRLVKENEQKILKDEYLSGYLSYVSDPLFLSNGQLRQFFEYDTIIQGHTHFGVIEKSEPTNIYSVKAAGMPCGSFLKNSLASYVILTEKEDGFDLTEIDVPYDRDKMVNSINTSLNPSSKIKRYTNII